MKYIFNLKKRANHNKGTKEREYAFVARSTLQNVHSMPDALALREKKGKGRGRRLNKTSLNNNKMHKDIDEICKAIDLLTIRTLELMEEKTSLNVQIENLLRDGHIELAKSKYICGKESISALQIPNGNEVTPLFDLETKLTGESDEEVPYFDVNLRKQEGENSLEDPIRWFGVLVPQNLRNAQKRFQESVYLAVSAANTQAKLHSVTEELQGLYLLKNAASTSQP